MTYLPGSHAEGEFAADFSQVAGDGNVCHDLPVSFHALSLCLRLSSTAVTLPKINRTHGIATELPNI